MAINNVKFKAQDPVAPPAEQPQQTGGTAPSIAEAEEMLKKLKAALNQIDYADKYDQYLSVGEKAQLEKYRALLMADVEALNYFLQTGDWMGPVLPANAGIAQQFFDINSVGTGWYMSDQNKNIMQPSVTPDGDEEIVPSDSQYMGTVNIEKTAMTDANGNIIPTLLWFVMGPGMKGIEGETIGKDLVITITYKEDGHKESYVIKNGAIRADIQVGVNALKVDDGIFTDFSKMLTINPDTGEKRGVYVIGSRFDDRITGGFGIDNLNGGGGNDRIEGLGESDLIFGHANSDVLSQYSVDTLGLDGDDEIYDVFGTDIIDGGPGAKDSAYIGNTTEISGQTWNVENEGELFTESGSEAKNLLNGWLDTDGWSELEYDSSKGEYYISKKDTSDNKINIDLSGTEEGYMISATRDEADIIYTFVRPGAPGSVPEYIKLRVKNYFNQTNTKTTIKNSFIDMSNDDINVGTNPVELIGTASAGDILLAPLTFLDEYGMNQSEIGSGNMSQEEIQSKLAVWQGEDTLDLYSIWKYIDDASDKKTGYTTESGEIIINWNDIKDQIIDKLFSIPTEFGAAAFVQYDESKNQTIITVISNKGDENKRLVIKIDGIKAKDVAALDVRLNMNSSSVHYIGEINGPGVGVTMNGGAGTDFMGGSAWGSSSQDESYDEMVKISYPGSVTDHEPVGTSDVMTTEDLSTEINNAGSFEMLEVLYEKVMSSVEDASEKNNLIDDIADKAKELMEEELENIELENESITKEEQDKLLNYLNTFIKNQLSDTVYNDLKKKIEDLAVEG